MHTVSPILPSPATWTTQMERQRAKRCVRLESYFGPEPLHQYDAEFLMARGRNYAVIVLYWSQRRAAKINRRRYTTSARYFGRIEVRMICFSSFYFVRLTGSEVTSIPVSIELIAHRVAPVYSWQIPTGPQHLECT